ncbi:DUF1801 domain-containing protein [Erysipelothrix sp. HDW6C]|uniref:iron chaperone n=1 Tax=Erysipelothrix sp. HDW6C TaxID=2714930 RepID=UPI00140C333E|nr:DUF1801 domain-containing protein [Erysipelothrix sp. HDW6C]QIK68828.1 DUF1801 domain-containing protein [Erysipelothrix sp. HDW6C]
MEVDKYIAGFDPEVQERLQIVRQTIREVVPDAEEVISYGMPAYKLGKVLVYFAAGKHHIGFYPTPSAILEFEPELQGLKYSKGAVQFANDKPLPLELIRKMTAFRNHEVNQK